jgi:L-ribulokinase
MQIYADVTGKEFHVAASSQAPALGSAMFGAVAAGATAGGYDSIVEAAAAMARLREESFRPDPEASATYDALYAEYLRLHDDFGRGGSSAMKSLREIRGRALGAATGQAVAPVD